MNIKKKIIIFFEILFGIPKSLIFNFKYLPFKQAVKLPIIISRYCSLLELDGEVIIKSSIIKPGMIMLGIGSLGIIDKKFNRSIIELGEKSKLILEGKIRLGNGFKISSNGEVIIGNNFVMTGDSKIFCAKKIIFGENCLVSWNVLIMDTDVHVIKFSNSLVNKDEEINIGNNVWVSCNSVILKGTTIKDNTVIGASSLVNKKFDMGNIILGGNPAKIVKKDIEWSIN